MHSPPAKHFVLLAVAVVMLCAGPANADDTLRLQLCDRTPNMPEGVDLPENLPEVADEIPWRVNYETVDWDPKKTAVIICDMWDKHWCPSASARVEEMAPRMNDVVKKLREQGVLVIHCPSSTLEHYKDTPARRRAAEVPRNAPVAPSRWYPLDPKKEAPLPIDDKNGVCEEDVESYDAWTHQTDAIEITDEDALTDNEEVYHLMHERGIENVLIMGVHTNMCVLGRPWGIRNLVTSGKNVVLVRDMTDALYRPDKEPFVSHVRGTELMVEHIEKFWCPTVTSADILGGQAFRFKEDDRKHIAILVSDDHYGADVTLPIYADTLRKQGYHVTIMHGEGTNDIRHTEELADADLLIIYIRRLALPKEQLDAVRAYVKSGRPVIGLRTSSHAFDTKGNIPEGCDNWVEFDAEIQGGNYHNHANNALESDIAVVPKMKDHPILSGLHKKTWHSRGSLYYTKPIADDCTLLLVGTTAEDGPEPILWYREPNGQKIVYCALGHPEDFERGPFGKLLSNIVKWCLEEN